jgi:glycine/D-amino acid oxidase-like deaminating enzyme
MGVTVEENCRLEGLVTENRRIRNAETTRGIYTADAYVLATGHGMSGISMATSTGKLVTEIITGRRPHIDPAAFGIHRFH